MSLRPMYKICPHCKKSFSYNPSVGDNGLICPYCGKSTTIATTVAGSILETLLKKRK